MSHGWGKEILGDCDQSRSSSSMCNACSIGGAIWLAALDSGASEGALCEFIYALVVAELFSRPIYHLNRFLIKIESVLKSAFKFVYIPML